MPPKKLKIDPNASSSSGINKAVPKVQEKRAKLFQIYAPKDTHVIGPAQMESLLKDLDVETTDHVRVLKLAWKMRAARQGYFTLEEWLRGLKTLKVDTIGKLRKVLAELEHEDMPLDQLYQFHTFSFGYYKTETQDFLEMERVCQLLKLVLGHRYPFHTESMVEFLKIQKEFTTITIDHWIFFLKFFQMVDYPNFDTFQSPHWPQILDDYVKWERNRQSDMELEPINALFKQYAGKDSTSVIGPQEIERLCVDLGVEILDVRVLMLAWKMKAAKQAYFTLEEWRRGFKELKVDTIDQLREVLAALDPEFMELQSFQDFYDYSFQYSLTEEMQKVLDMESACQLLELVLRKRYLFQVESLVQFLKDQKEYRAINFDQWRSFVPFFHQFIYPNFENYDSSLGWPSVLDNYVEWAQKKQN